MFIRILLFCLLTACNPVTNPSQEFFSEELKYFITDTLYLEKDYNTKILDGNMVYLEKEQQEYLYTFKDYRLLQYAYPSGKLMATQEYEKEGPNGIGTWVSGHLIEQDEMFFISNAKELIRADHQGNVLQRYPLPEAPAERLGANYNTMNNNPMFYQSKENELVLPDVPFVLKEPHLKYKNWIVKLNLDNGNFQHIAFQYPTYYSKYLDDPELGAYFHTTLWDQGKHLVSFAATDSILVLAEDQQQWIDGKSRESLNFLPGKTEVNGEWTVYSPDDESSRYRGFLNDPFQKKIGRGVIVGLKQKSGDQPYYLKSFVLFDEKLEKIGELLYTSNEFMEVGFATPDGFYFPLAQQPSDDKTAYVKVNLPESLEKK